MSAAEANLAGRYDAFIIDLDGVIYLMNEPVPGSAETVRRLASEGKKFIFLSNNSAPTVPEYIEKLGRFGIEIDDGQIINSALAVRRYLERNHDYEDKTAFVIGEEGLRAAIGSMGIRLLEGEEGRRADFVFVGWDRRFDYEKLKVAELAVRNGAVYVATNTDATYPTPVGLWPGTGSLVAAVNAASGAEPVVVGKPDPFIIHMAIEKLGSKPEESLVIGDRLDTDIEAGIAAGVDTLLVLSGVSTEKDLEETGVRPTYVRRDLSGLFDETA